MLLGNVTDPVAWSFYFVFLNIQWDSRNDRFHFQCAMIPVRADCPCYSMLLLDPVTWARALTSRRFTRIHCRVDSFALCQSNWQVTHLDRHGGIRFWSAACELQWLGSSSCSVWEHCRSVAAARKQQLQRPRVLQERCSCQEQC